MKSILISTQISSYKILSVEIYVSFYMVTKRVLMITWKSIVLLTQYD